ncbi:MAG: CpXC domain-containing protein, partial [Ruthenibacterium lactatiformans]
MSLRRKKTVACPKCNKESDYLFWESLNGDLDPEAKTQLIDGTFFQFKCPHCGHECKVDYGMCALPGFVDSKNEEKTERN